MRRYDWFDAGLFFFFVILSTVFLGWPEGTILVVAVILGIELMGYALGWTRRTERK